MGTLATGARIAHVLVLGMWMGSIAAFGLVRSRADALLGSWHLADQLVRDLASWLDFFGLVAGPLALVTLVVGWAPLQVPLRARGIGLFVATVIAAICGRWIGPRRAELVAELGRRLEDVPAGSERMIELGQLQQVASTLLVLLFFSTALLTAAAVRGSQPRRRFGIEL